MYMYVYILYMFYNLDYGIRNPQCRESIYRSIIFLLTVLSSVSDQFHFDMDPDPLREITDPNLSKNRENKY